MLLTPRWTPLRYNEQQQALAFTDKRFVVVPSGRRSGKCLAEGSLITMADGTWKKIEDVKIEDLVLSVDFNTYKLELKRVSQILPNGLKKTLIVSTRSRTFVPTLNHPFLIDNKWVEAEDIKEGQLLGIAKHIDLFGNMEMDLDELDFLAIWLAEGHDYTISNGNFEIKKRIFEIAEKWDLTIKQYAKVDWYLGVKERVSTHKGSYTTHKGRLFLESLGLWGKNSKTKFIPDIIFNLKKEQLARFLNLFMCCDGYFHKVNEHRSPGFSIGLANELLIKQFSLLFSKFGIYGRICHKISKKKNKHGDFFESWNYTTSETTSVINFCEQIGMISKPEQVLKSLEIAKNSKGTANNSFLPLTYEDLLPHLKYEPVKDAGTGYGSRFNKGHVPKIKKIQDAPQELCKLLGWLRKDDKRELRKNNKFVTVRKFKNLQKYMDGYFDNLIGGDISWEEVVSVKDGGIRPTYDLTVEDNHNFLVENAVTHNTEIAKRKVITEALKADKRWEDPRFFCAAPTREQCRRIYWTDLKNMIPAKFVTQMRETDLSIYLVNGAEIHLIGMDKPERIEGTPWNGGVLDEYANMKERAWYENVRPALSDRNGWCWFIGVPEGRNHYYDLFKYAQDENNPLWGAYHWKSSDILSKEEIASAKHDLDELTYKQEYEGDFVFFQGKAYYNFDAQYHCQKLTYNPKNPLIFCFDFNVSPGVAVVCQEFPMLDENDNYVENESITGVIGEVYVPRNSNSEIITKRLIQQWSKHNGAIYVYGDASGGQMGSAKLQGSDWDIIIRMLMKEFGINRVFMRVPRANPPERSRVNAVNSRLKSLDGVVRLLIDPNKAPMLIKDFEGVRVQEGTNGAIDKGADLNLSHNCFDFNTLVETEAGFYKMGKLPFEGRIRTWDGSFADYTNGGICVGEKECVEVEFSDGVKEVCTPDHMFLTEKGWLPVIDSVGLYLYNWKLFSWRMYLCYIKSLMAKNTNGMGFIIAEQGTKDCMLQFGNFIMERLKKEIVFITKMEIGTTTQLKILLKCLYRNICNTICNALLEKKKQKKLSENLQFLHQKNGMGVKREGNGTDNMLWERKKENMNRSVLSAVKNFFQRIFNIREKKELNSVPITAKCDTEINQELTIINSSVFGAEKNLEEVNILEKQCIVQKHAITNIKLVIKRKELQEFAKFAIKNTLMKTTVVNSAHKPAMVSIVAITSVGKRKIYCPTVLSMGSFSLCSSLSYVLNSDSLGYYIQREFPVRSGKTGMVAVGSNT